MLSNMAASLILHKRIKTTVAKAKVLRKIVEPLITKAKTDSTHARRLAFSYLKHKEPVKELFAEVAPKVGDRPGGYTRILRIGNRLGDNAEMCIMELVDYNDLYTANKKAAAKAKRSRRGGGGKKKATGTKKAEAAAAEATEAPAENTEATSSTEE